MGRIKHRKSVWTDAIDKVYNKRDTSSWVDGVEDFGTLLGTAEKLYKSPLLKDAAAGVADLFSGDGEDAAAGAKIVNEAATARTDMMSSREDATKDFKEAQGQEAKTLDKTAPVQMPTTDAKGQQEVRDLKARSVAAGRVGGFFADQALGQEQVDTEARILQLDREGERIQTAVTAADPNAEKAYDIYNNQRQLFEQLKGLAELETDPQAKQAYTDQANNAKTQMNQAFGAFEQVRGLKDTEAAIDSADTAAQLRLSNIQGLRDELKAKATSKAQQLSAMASKKAAELNQSTEEAIASAVNKFIGGGTLSDEEQAKFDAMRSKLQVDEETGDIILNVSTEERVAISNDPEMSVYLAAATKQLEQELQQPIGGARTGDALAGALAGETVIEETGPTATVATEEITEEANIPAGTSVLPSGPVGTSTRNDIIRDTRDAMGSIASDYPDARENIDPVIAQLRARTGADAIDENTIRNISEIMSGGSTVPEGGIQVPNIGGMSIQEAEGVAMEIAASSGSMAAKQKAMRNLIQQASTVDDVVPAWMARGGTLGYLDESMAADRLRKAFTGMMPKPKAAKPRTVTEDIKLRGEAGKQESQRLKNLKLEGDIVTDDLMRPILARNELFQPFSKFPALLKLKEYKKSVGGSGKGNKKDLDKFRIEVRSAADSTAGALKTSTRQLTNKIAGINELTIAEAVTLDPNTIAKEYGPDLRTYLTNLRNAKDNAAKTKILNQMKNKMKVRYSARLKSLTEYYNQLSDLQNKIRSEVLNKVDREKAIRGMNDLLTQIQKASL